MKKLLMVVLVAVAVAVPASSDPVFGASRQPKKKATSEVSKDQALLEKAKGAAKYDLKDPDSAQFRGVHISKDKPREVHGEINSKNSYGGYVGFEKFLYSIDNGKVIFSSAIIENNRAWEDACDRGDRLLEQSGRTVDREDKKRRQSQFDEKYRSMFEDGW